MRFPHLMRNPIILLGAPNVGKSALFNRLSQTGKALVGSLPGLTRDVQEATFGEHFTLLDSQGFENIDIQSVFLEDCLKRAALLLFVVDSQKGLTVFDQEWLHRLRKRGKTLWVLVNKCDSHAEHGVMQDIEEKGFFNVFPVSAKTGLGCDEIACKIQGFMDQQLDNQEVLETSANLQDHDEKATQEPLDSPLRLVMLGRPNTGKSTLVNTLLGYERVAAGSQPGLTRDTVKISFSLLGKPISLWDTAGIWRKSHQKDYWTKQTEKAALEAVRFAEIVLLLIDVTRPLERGDLQLIQHVINEGRCLVLVMNKSDLIDNKQRKDIQADLQSAVPDIRYACPVFISASEKKGLSRLKKAILTCYAIWQKEIVTSKLNTCLQFLQQKHPAPLVKGRRLVIKYGVQKKSRPPTFWLFSNHPQAVSDAYKNYLINGLRRTFGLEGVPIRLFFKKTNNPYVSG